jgi:flagellar motility protein MotE (MotC chaperone)
MTLMQRIRILPLLVIVSLLSLGVRVGEFATGLGSSGVAFAQQEVDEPVPPLPGGDAAHDEPATPPADSEDHAAEQPETVQGSDAAPPMHAPGADASPDTPKAMTEQEWRDATESDYEYSEVRAELFRDLSKRREEIEKREKALAAREALLLAAERELDQKTRELTGLKAEIEGLLKDQSDEEQARIGSLVQIYEGMKSKDAARIFNTLDMDVLIQVMSRMSERKSAPILAEMDSERARTVTVLLSQQKQLPTLPQQ